MQSSVYEKSTKVPMTKQEYRVQLSLTHKVQYTQCNCLNIVYTVQLLTKRKCSCLKKEYKAKKINILQRPKNNTGSAVKKERIQITAV